MNTHNIEKTTELNEEEFELRRKGLDKLCLEHPKGHFETDDAQPKEEAQGEKKVFEVKFYLENINEGTDEEKKMIVNIVQKSLYPPYPHGYYLTKMGSRLVPESTLKIEKKLEEKQEEYGKTKEKLGVTS